MLYDFKFNSEFIKWISSDTHPYIESLSFSYINFYQYLNKI